MIYVPASPLLAGAQRMSSDLAGNTLKCSYDQYFWNLLLNWLVDVIELTIQIPPPCNLNLAIKDLWFQGGSSSMVLFPHFPFFKKQSCHRCTLIFSDDLTRPLLNCKLHLASSQLLPQTSLSDQLGMDLWLPPFLSICLLRASHWWCPWFVPLVSSPGRLVREAAVAEAAKHSCRTTPRTPRYLAVHKGSNCMFDCLWVP